MSGQRLFCTTVAISTSQNTFENRFTLVRNVSEKCNREMIRDINARDEPTCHAEVAVARSLALGKAATPWNQLRLLLLWHLIPTVVKPPPNIHHAGVEAVDGPRLNQKQRPVGSGEKPGVSLFSSKSRLHTFFGGGQVWDKRKQYNLYNPASHLRNIVFRKV